MYSKIRVCARPLVCLPARPPARLAGRPPVRPPAVRVSARPSQAPGTPRAPYGSACSRLRVSARVRAPACPSVRVSARPSQPRPRVRLSCPPAPAHARLSVWPSVGRVHRVDRPTDCPFCPLPPAPTVYLSASPIVRLPFLSASPCTVRLPVRIFLFFGGGLLFGGPFFLCGCGRVYVSGSGRTEDATQRAFTCETFVRVPGKTPLAEPLWTMPAIDMAATVPLRGHCRALCALHARPCLKTPR